MAEETEDLTSYKLIYFPVKALAEPIRYLLNYGKINFEDVRLERAKFQTLKDVPINNRKYFVNGPFPTELPFGQVPVLEINDKVVHQSVAISRYLAKTLNLVGLNEMEDLEIDSMVDTIVDLRSKISSYNMTEEGDEKDQLKETLNTETIPFYLAKFDTIAESGYMALGRLTWADIYFVSILEYCNGIMGHDIIENYPNLLELRAKIQEIPAIKQWIEKRPESDY